VDAANLTLEQQVVVGNLCTVLVTLLHVSKLLERMSYLFQLLLFFPWWLLVKMHIQDLCQALDLLNDLQR
jgi:hypothetical protein